MANPHIDDITMLLYARGDQFLSEQAVQHVRLHLPTCAECRSRLERATDEMQEEWASTEADADVDTSEQVIEIVNDAAQLKQFGGGPSMVLVAPTLPAVRSEAQGPCAPVADFDRTLVEELPRAEVGTNWRAFDQCRRAYVVVVELPAYLHFDEKGLERFRHKLELVAGFTHPCVVPVLAAHLIEPPFFYVRPVVSGKPVNRYCEDRRLPVRARLELLVQICGAVSYAHERAAIHGALKPSNIFIDDDGWPQLPDFGLRHALGDILSPLAWESSLEAACYASPEQAKGMAVDARTDVYSLGVILFQLLTGRLPIDAGASLEEVRRRISDEPPPEAMAVNPRIGRELSAIILRALAKDPGDRFQSARELADDLRAVLESRPTSVGPKTVRYRFRKWLVRSALRVLSWSPHRRLSRR